jgi:putative chitinase
MSFDIFKKNMTSYMQNQKGVTTYQDFAKKLTMEYDMCVRRGYQTINSVIIQKANTEMMETMVVIACSIALQKQKGLHGVINDIGKGVVGYWTGATLNNFPAPIIPAIGSFLNITSVSAMVTDPGKFPEMGMQYPTMDVGVFLDALIMGMTMHLTTISGMYMTLSMYPGVPTTISPGMLPWTGYTIPPAKPSVEVPAVEEPTAPIEANTTVSVSEAVTLSPQQEIVADGATKMGYGMNVSTGAATSGATKITPPTPKDDIEQYPIPEDATEEAIMKPQTQKIDGCDGNKIVAPPQSVIDAMRKWGIRKPLERAHFLAQCAHESGNFRYTREIWGPTRAQNGYDTHRYLGNEEAGDGKKYMGRGYIQLTGKSNYRKFNKGVPDNVVKNPTLVESKYPGDTACWFWMTRTLNKLAIDDTIGSVTLITKTVNGGKNGLDDRVKKFCGYWKQIQANPDLYS